MSIPDELDYGSMLDRRDLRAQNDRLRHLLEQAATLYDTLDRRSVSVDWYNQVVRALRDKP